MGFFGEIWDTIKSVAAPAIGLATGNPWLALGASTLLGGSSSSSSSSTDYSKLLSGVQGYTPSIPNLFTAGTNGEQGLGTAYMKLLQQQMTSPTGLTNQEQAVQTSSGMQAISSQAAASRANLAKHFASRGMLQSGAYGGALANVEKGRMQAAGNLAGQVSLADAAAERQEQQNAMSGIANLIGMRENAASGSASSAMQLAQLQLQAQQAADAGDAATYNQLMQAISSIYQATNTGSTGALTSYPTTNYTVGGLTGTSSPYTYSFQDPNAGNLSLRGSWY
jgi:hypothetical protein